MDRSLDSIGSCSLDVDADSTDFSDTSGELNFLTPSSAKDITKDFTAGIRERCKIPIVNYQPVTTVLDPITGNINTVLSTTTSPTTETTAKKPSYLNLACCVNGYSNLTTYDSTLRRNINKSREVSPNRPIIATLHYNRTEGNSYLTAPNLSYISMNSNSNSLNILKMSQQKETQDQDVTDNVHINGNGPGFLKSGVKIFTEKKSFIQQRVEKLYGHMEGVVISKQIYSSNERKYLNNIANNHSNNVENIENEEENSESLPVFRHLRPEFRAQLQVHSPKKSPRSPPSHNQDILPTRTISNDGAGVTNGYTYMNGSMTKENNDENLIPSQQTHNNHQNDNTESNCRKIIVKQISPPSTNNSTITTTLSMSSTQSSVDVEAVSVTTESSETIGEHCDIVVEGNSLANMKLVEEQPINGQNGHRHDDTNGQNGAAESDNKENGLYGHALANNQNSNNNNDDVIKDGTYFLGILKNEQNRLITLANNIEQELEQLTKDGVEISEEVVGHLRSASGKARLLATQKMKQFEGLCYNNLNQLPDEKFQTTKEDLQGFWDMVMLQVNHIDTLFQEIETIKSNGWQTPKPSSPKPQVKSKSTKLVKRPYKTPASNGITNSDSKKTAAAQRREDQRRQLMEIKRKQKLAANSQPDQIEIFAPES